MKCTIRVAKTKALISFAVTAKLICVFVFAYADCWFSHEEAHLIACAKTTFQLKRWRLNSYIKIKIKLRAMSIHEPRREKTGLRGFRPGPT